MLKQTDLISRSAQPPGRRLVLDLYAARSTLPRHRRSASNVQDNKGIAEGSKKGKESGKEGIIKKITVEPTSHTLNVTASCTVGDEKQSLSHEKWHVDRTNGDIFLTTVEQHDGQTFISTWKKLPPDADAVNKTEVPAQTPDYAAARAARIRQSIWEKRHNFQGKGEDSSSKGEEGEVAPPHVSHRCLDKNNNFIRCLGD